MRNTLITLAKIHYQLGIINYDEFNERFGVALWLADELPDNVRDPRVDSEEDVFPYEESDNDENSGVSAVTSFERNSAQPKDDDEKWLELVCLGLWIFTKADPDSYPSVPHGHYTKQNNKWPKLNPFTGRVFTEKHQEDKKQKLSKKQMQRIWSNEKFKSFCREMIVWYQEQFPHYDFPVLSPLRMPRWK